MSAHRATPRGSTPSFRRYNLVLIETYKAPAQSANPVTFWVFNPFDPGAAAASSGLGLKAKERVRRDHVPRRIPVGSTPAYTAQTPPDSCAPNDRTSAAVDRSAKEFGRVNDLAPSSNHWILDRPLMTAWVISSECLGPRPWSVGIGKESNACTRVDWVGSKTLHGASLDRLTRTWP
jgi:hypothetical protein